MYICMCKYAYIFIDRVERCNHGLKVARWIKSASEQSKRWCKCSGGDGQTPCRCGNGLPPDHLSELWAGQNQRTISENLSKSKNMVSKLKSCLMMAWTWHYSKGTESSDPSGISSSRDCGFRLLMIGFRQQRRQCWCLPRAFCLAAILTRLEPAGVRYLGRGGGLQVLVTPHANLDALHTSIAAEWDWLAVEYVRRTCSFNPQLIAPSCCEYINKIRNYLLCSEQYCRTSWADDQQSFCTSHFQLSPQEVETCTFC